MVKAYEKGLIANNLKAMKEVIWMINEMAMEFINIAMEIIIKDIDKMMFTKERGSYLFKGN